MEKRYPPSLAESWDNVGLLIGDEDKEVKKIFLALDATSEAIEKAKGYGADMMITHHPLIFSGIKRINAKNYLGCRIIELIKQDISYYAMHTNFDICCMAELSADYIQLSSRFVLEVTYEDGNRKEGIGRVGMLPHEMSLRECAGFVKENLRLPHVRVYGDMNQMIRTAAISTGSGKSMIDIAAASDAQVLITGDIDYHTGIDAPAKGIAIIDAGHYGTEYIFINYMKRELEQEFPMIAVEGMSVKQPYELI